MTPHEATPPAATDVPLDGLLVLDLSRALAGPHAAMVLGDLGARVIKVESPGGGDESRGWGPPFVEGSDGQQHSTYFLSCNRNKESIALDLKDADDADLLWRLIRRADVLIENFRPGVMERLGLGFERLQAANPRLVLLSISGFGADGPEAQRPGYDQIAQGEAGLMSLTGSSPEEPMRVGVPIGDLLAGMYGVQGILAALHQRERTGTGRHVTTSLLASIVGVHAFQGTRYTVAGETPTPSGPHHPSICPYGLFQASDGPVQIAVGTEGMWSAFATEFGLVNHSWSTNAARVAERPRVHDAIDNAFGTLRSDDLLRRLTALGIPCGRVRTLDQVYEWEQTLSQGLVVDVDHPALGAIRLPGPAVRFDGRLPAGGRLEHTAPPLLDQHGAEIRAWLGPGPGPTSP